MAAFTRSNPQPLVTHMLIPTRRKYQLVRMKEMLSHVLGAGGIFGGGEMSASSGRNLFQTDTTALDEPLTGDTTMEDAPMLPPEGTKRSSISQPSGSNRAVPNAPKKSPATANA
jgi:hypothetical protein